MNKISLENLQISSIEYDFPEPFDDEKIKKKILSLLPSTKREKLSFYLNNTNTGIANGIRRTIQGELKNKALYCEVSDIKTTEDFIIISELIDRIRLIPINQEISTDAEFKLEVINTELKKDEKIVYSYNLQQVKGDKLSYLFPETIQLARLSPGKSLVITNIKIKEGYGFEHAGFCLTNNVEYDITDYIVATFINKKSNFVNYRVHYMEIMQLLDKQKTKYQADLYKKKILVIPEKKYLVDLKNAEEKLKKFDYVIYANVKTYQSAEIHPRNFYMSFITNGNIKTKNILKMACDNLTERLENIKQALTKKDQNLVSVLTDNIKTSIIIRGEDYTISEIIKKTIYDIEPTIGLINSTLEHVSNRTVIINIIHTDAIGIFKAGIEAAQKSLALIKD